MRSFPTAITDALASGVRTFEMRDFIWVSAKNRSTGDPEAMGFWNGSVDVTAGFVDGFTGEEESRAFIAAGALLGVGPVPMTSDLTVRNLTIRLSPISAAVEQLIRGFNARGAPLTYGRGVFDPRTKALLGPVQPWFVGFIDDVDLPTVSEGQTGAATVTVVSHTRELTITSPDVRSHESQLARSGGTDHFYADTAVVGEWEHYWGQAAGKLPGGGGGSTAGHK